MKKRLFAILTALAVVIGMLPIYSAAATDTIDIPVEKIWQDNGNQDGNRPDSVTVTLKAEGNAIGSVTFSGESATADSWSGTFSGVKQADLIHNGEIADLTLDEELGSAYEAMGYDHQVTLDVTPTFTLDFGWDVLNGNPQSVELESEESIVLIRLGNDIFVWSAFEIADPSDLSRKIVGSLPNNLTTGASTPQFVNGYKKFDLFEVSDNNGKPYVEIDKSCKVAPCQMTVEIDASMVGSASLTNVYTPPTTDINVTKTWVDGNNKENKRPDSITVRAMNGSSEAANLDITERDGWKGTFTLPKYKNGEEVTYSITEDSVENYETSIDGYNITNTYVADKILGSKKWVDQDNKSGNRPDSAKAELMKNGAATGQYAVANENNFWGFEFSKLPIYDADGNEIEYTIQEVDIPAGYTPYYVTDDNKMLIIMNVYEAAVTEVKVIKEWSDSDDQYKKRPDSITINLLADGNQIESKVVTAADEWQCSFEDLPVFNGTQEIVYTVAEATVDNYSSEVKGSAADGYTVTNTCTYEPPVEPGDDPSVDPEVPEDNPSEEIIEDDSEDEEISEETGDKKESKSPKTNDITDMSLLAFMMILSLAGAGIAGYLRRKEN